MFTSHLRDKATYSLVIFLVVFLLLESSLVLFLRETTKLIYFFAVTVLYLLYFIGSFKRVSRLQVYKVEALLFLLFIAMVISSVSNGVSLVSGIQVSMFSLKFIPVYLLLLTCNLEKFHNFKSFVLLVLIVEAVLGFIQYLFPPINEWFILLNTYDLDQYRIDRLLDSGRVGTFVSKNVYGTVMNIGFALSFELFQQKKKSKFAILQVVFLSAIFVSGSKVNMIIVSSFLLYIYRHKIHILFIAFTALIVAFMYFLLSNNSFNFNFLKLFSQEYYDISREYGRLQLLTVSGEVISNNPFFGIGAGNWGTGFSYYALREGQMYATYNGIKVLGGVLQDNFWLSLASQFGLIYTLLFVMVLLDIYGKSDKSLATKYLLYILIVTSFAYPSFDMKIISFLMMSFFALNRGKIGTAF